MMGAADVSLASTTHAISIESLRRSLNYRRRRWFVLIGVLVAIVAVLGVVMLMVGNTNYSLGTVWSVLTGEEIKGATYAIWEVRLPRLLAALLVGFAFGVAGNTFQTMLRNPLASPDVIGITSGASVAAVFCILVLSMGAASASLAAMVTSLLVAAAIYGLSSIGGFSGASSSWWASASRPS